MPDAPPQIPRLKRLRNLIDGQKSNGERLTIGRSFAEELYRELEAYEGAAEVCKNCGCQEIGR